MHTSTQAISCVISSPFLRCMQTAQQICHALQLPGIHTCNGIVDVLNGHCGIHEQPEVPASDVAKYGINVLVYHNEPLPKYPERTRDGLKRLAMVIVVAYFTVMSDLTSSLVIDCSYHTCTCSCVQLIHSCPLMIVSGIQ